MNINIDDLKNREQNTLSLEWLSFLFLISGFAALIYQIVWQRSLFTAFGINIESVTIIVSIFMFGLGIGSLVGGILSKRFPSLLPHIFLLCEVLIGIFGIASLKLISVVADLVIHYSLFTISLSMFGLLCIPTIFMGATLPILVTYIHKYYENIGKSVGKLYFMNTAGSAIACFVTANIFFVLFGQKTTILIAVSLNFIVGLLVYRYIKEDLYNPGVANISSFKCDTNRYRVERTDTKNIKFFLILLLSGMVGYISLSQEIIWVKIISYASGGTPDVFAYILTFFLFGIAYGSLVAKKLCETDRFQPLPFIATMLFMSSVVYYFSMPMIGHLLTIWDKSIVIAYLVVGINASLLGGIFPVISHFSIRSKTSVGYPLSWIYFANIVGSTAGPLLTGFVLLNYFSIEKNVFFISIATLIISGVVWMISGFLKAKNIFFVGITIIIISITLFHEKVYHHILEKFHYKTAYTRDKSYKYVVQNRAGIIAVEDSLTDVIYGDGVYDGQFNIDPVLNTNGITRAYMIAALHPKPKEILAIGLGSGSWAKVIASHADVKKLTLVEINPGYMEVIKNYPDTSIILNDPKVTIHIDDGRRWLNRNPDANFDVIVLNTSFHWRNHVTNILSEEFLRLCKRHLKPNGIIYYNTTGSLDAVYTAMHVFKYVVMHENFVAASDSPFSMTIKEKIENLLKFRNKGTPIFDLNDPKLNKILNRLAFYDLSDKIEQIKNKHGLSVITDDNMLTEFKKINNQSRLQFFKF